MAKVLIKSRGRINSLFTSFRYLRVYAADQKFKCVHSISKMTGPPDQVGGVGDHVMVT